MVGITEFLAAHAPSPWITVSILSFGPVSESRGGIIYGMLAGLDPTKVFLVSVAPNILAIPFIFWLLSAAR